MKEFFPRTWLSGFLLGLALALTLLIRTGNAACGPGELSDFCSANYGLAGDLAAVAGRSAGPGPIYPSVESPQAAMAGPLSYADLKAIEQQARALLAPNLAFRRDISPYQETGAFADLVARFDAASGFNWFNSNYTDPQNRNMTLVQRIDLAEAELRQARDLYAYLAVYAPQARFRQDAEYLGGAGLCGAVDKEDANPPDPAHSGQVLPPIIDWCNFPARLRQSVREAAYIRMIFAQQFMVKALGMHFSGSKLIGGEQFVRQELANLQAAVHQYDLAEQTLLEVLDVRIGSGCYVSDYFTAPEWSLLLRASEGKQLAQHHIATRLSYMDITRPEHVQQAQAKAQGAYRAAAIEGYVKLIGMAGRAALPLGEGCNTGAAPENLLVADMVARLLDTRSQAADMRQGRNVFGFDDSFTPARTYRTAAGSADRGLFEQAQEAANRAKQIQADTEAAERQFDQSQQALMDAIAHPTSGLKTTLDKALNDMASCDSNTMTDSELIACVNEQIELISACPVMAASQAEFDACVNDPRILGGSTLLQKVKELRATWLEVQGVQQRIDNMAQRVQNEMDRNATVTDVVMTNGREMAGFDFAMTLLDSFQVSCAFKFLASGCEWAYNPLQPVIAALAAGKAVVEATNNVKIENANSKEAVQGLLLDAAELVTEKQVAYQHFAAGLTEFEGAVGETQKYLADAIRLRAYILASPANDPSYRMVRDSRRLQLAAQLDSAARLSYLAARRAEYETTGRLSGSGIRISDLYKARTADDILDFLLLLDNVVSNLPGSARDAETNQRNLRISVAWHVLGLSDEALGLTGPAAEAERVRRLRAWVAEHTSIGANGKPVLSFSIPMSTATNGIFSRAIQQGYGNYWLHKVAGIGQPKPANTGLGLNLLTAQQVALHHREVRVEQTGLVEMRSFAGCLFTYRLVPPAVMLGLEWPANQPSDIVTGGFQAAVNGANGNPTPAFLGRPVAASHWRVIVFAGSPDGILPDMDLQQLTDVELNFSTTYATRPSTTPPLPADCVRADY